MTTEPSVALEEVALAYRMATHRGSTLKEVVINSWRRQIEFRDFVALEDVSFEISPGEVVGVMGPNGAGKSTLMKVVAQVLPPTSGRVRVRGRVAPLIELGAGFDPELSAAENIVLYGTLLGQTPRALRIKASAILEWAGLTEFRDVPLRAFSSGMLARLAFAIAVDDQPDVLLVDEVLSVGDGEFQQRSRERLEALIASGSAVMLVSHDVVQLRTYASKVVWLHRGRIRQLGDPVAVTRAYEDDYRRTVQQHGGEAS